MYLGTSFSFEPGCGTQVLERDVSGRGVFNLTKIAQNIILYCTNQPINLPLDWI